MDPGGTEAGEELRPLIMQLGTWGQRWSRSRMAADDLDASFLMWDIRRNVRVNKLPLRRVVVHFEFPDAKKKGMRQWWLVIEDGEVDLCLDDPGHEIDVAVVTSLRTMTQIWMGDSSLARAQAQGLVKISGPSSVTRNFPEWLGASPFASVAPGVPREAMLA